MHTVVNQGCGCIWLVRRCLCSLQSTANEPYRNDISPLLYGDAVLLDEAERPLGKLRRRVLQLTDLRGCEGTRAYLQTCDLLTVAAAGSCTVDRVPSVGV